MSGSTGFIAMGFWHFHTPVIYLLYILGAGLVVISLAEIGRFNSSSFAVCSRPSIALIIAKINKQEQYEKRLGVLMRMSEKHKINGVIWYIIAVMFCLIFYPRGNYFPPQSSHFPADAYQ